MVANCFIRSAVWLAVFQLSLGGLAFAQTSDEAAKKSPPVDPTGTWKWQYSFNDNEAEFELKLNWDGKELTGTYTAFDNSTKIEKAKFENNQVSFIALREFNGNEFEVGFRGEVKPDDIEGTVTVDFNGNGPQEFDWNPKRVVELDDVVGTWDLRVETANGVIEPKLTVTKQGDKLQGKSVSQVFGEMEAKNLQLKENVLSWEVTGVNGGTEIHVKYQGKPRGNLIEGTNEFTVNGNAGGTMEFTGKRTPPEKKEEARPSIGETPAAESRPTTPAGREN